MLSNSSNNTTTTTNNNDNEIDSIYGLSNDKTKNGQEIEEKIHLKI